MEQHIYFNIDRSDFSKFYCKLNSIGYIGQGAIEGLSLSDIKDTNLAIKGNLVLEIDTSFKIFRLWHGKLDVVSTFDHNPTITDADIVWDELKDL